MYKNKEDVIKWRESHKEYIRAYNRKKYLKLKAKGHYTDYYKKNREKYYAVSLKRFYGMSLEQYKVLLSQQKGCCAICNDYKGKSLVVDHCHKTKKIRGLLCRMCNVGLGAFKDNTDLAWRMIEYLKKDEYDYL